MTQDSSLANSQTRQRKRSWGWLIYVVAALALIALLAWATQKEIARNPARDATADLGPYGPVTIRLSTAPNPPLPTGSIQLSFMPMDPRLRPVSVDSISFEYGREGDDRPVGSGEAQLMPDGSGMFMGGARLPEVGNWWVRVKVAKGGANAEVRFSLYVKPAQ